MCTYVFHNIILFTQLHALHFFIPARFTENVLRDRVDLRPEMCHASPVTVFYRVFIIFLFGLLNFSFIRTTTQTFCVKKLVIFCTLFCYCNNGYAMKEPQALIVE